MLVGCSNKPIVQPPKHVLIKVPESLLAECEIVSAVKDGKASVGSLAKAYISNTASLGVCNEQIKRIKQWQEQQSEQGR